MNSSDQIKAEQAAMNTEWDSRTQPCLRAIEDHAAWISHYCGAIKNHTKQLEYAIARLKQRPDWDTKAQDELMKSVEQLQLTMALCRSALTLYDMKPVILPSETTTVTNICHDNALSPRPWKLAK